MVARLSLQNYGTLTSIVNSGWTEIMNWEAAPAPQRDLYLVIGLNRSGTSALTKALSACGMALDFEQPTLPLGLWKPDTTRADGGYESYEIPAILQLVRQIASRFGGDPGNPILTDE